MAMGKIVTVFNIGAIMSVLVLIASTVSAYESHQHKLELPRRYEAKRSVTMSDFELEILVFLYRNRYVVYAACAGLTTGTIFLLVTILHYAYHKTFRALKTKDAQTFWESNPAEGSFNLQQQQTGNCGVESISMSATMEHSHSPSNRFSDALLRLCDQNTPFRFAQILDMPQGDASSAGRCVWLASGDHSQLFVCLMQARRVVLKIIPLVDELFEYRLTQSLDMQLQLSALRYATRYRTCNFVEIQRASCVSDNFPHNFFPAAKKRSHQGVDSVEDSGGVLHYVSRRFVVLEMSYAGVPITQTRLHSCRHGKSLMQQLACSLAVAEMALNYHHLETDSASRTLVAPTDAATLEYRFDDVLVSVEMCGLKAILVGTMCHSKAQLFEEGQTANVKWLRYLFNLIVDKLIRDIFPERLQNEAALMATLQSWSQKLNDDYNSVSDFVLNHFVPRDEPDTSVGLSTQSVSCEKQQSQQISSS